MTIDNLFTKDLDFQKEEKQYIITRFKDEKITSDSVDFIKSSIKENFPELGWCYTRTKKQLVADERNHYIWFAIGGKVRQKALIFCFTVKNQVITDVTVQDERPL